MRHSLIAIVVTLLVLVAAAAVHVTRSDDETRAEGGPLACDDCAAHASSIPAPLNVPVSFGLIFLRNEGTHPATLERVRLLDMQPGIEMVGSSVVRPTGRVGLLVGYPPADPRSPVRRLRGFVVPPAGPEQRTFQVVLGVRLTRYGRSFFRHVEIDYRVDGALYRAVFRTSLAICASRQDAYPDCDTPPP